MKNKYLLSLFCFSFSSLALAGIDDQQQINERLNDQAAPREHFPTRQATPESHPTTVKSSSSDRKGISLTKEQFLQHPDLVVRALESALQENNQDNVVFLLPFYQQLPAQYQNDVVRDWATAITEKRNQNYRKAIQLYRNIIAAHSDFTVIRLHLAIALFENNEYTAAEDQFQKLRSEPLPNNILQLIDQYLLAITQKDPWEFSGGLTYLNDPNINNAPKSGTKVGGFVAGERESAQGVGFNLDINKNWAWGDGFFNSLRLNGRGKYYWDNKKYNDYSGRMSLGFGYRNAYQELALLPFMEQTWYGGGSNKSETAKRFSKSGGATLEFSHWFSPHWQFNGLYEYAEQRYTTRKHLNGNIHFVSANLFYLANAKQYWFAGVNYNRTHTRDKDDSFIRKGINVGWGQEWGKGLSTRLSVNYAHKNYLGPMPIFLITQRNKEYGVTASIWHRALNYKGITPRLTWAYHKVKSNHDFYTYDKQQVFLEFSKKF